MAFASQDSKDGISYTGARSANTITFTLLGGKYLFATSAPSTSTEIDVLMPDGSTYVPVVPAFTAAGTAVLDLVPGSYRIILTATADVTGFIQKIPYSPSY